MPAPLSANELALLPQIEAWVAQHRAPLTDDLAQWVAIPSISRADRAQPGAPFGQDCARVLHHVLSQAASDGFRTENHQGYAGSVIYGSHARDIGLIGHLDVVPPGDNWTYPPFALTRHGDFLIGRGVADNKGPALMNLYLLKLVRDLAIPLHHNLRLVYGLAEETDMADMRWFALHGPVPDVSIVTDGRFPVNHAQKGQLTFELRLSDAGLLAGIRAGTAGNSVPERAQVLLSATASARAIDAIAHLPHPLADSITLTPPEPAVLQTQGNGGHAAFPDGTCNAALLLLAALSGLGVLTDREQQQAQYLQQLFASPYGEAAGIGLEDAPSGKLTLNAGVWHSPEPGTLAVTCDIRYPVSFHGETVLSALRQRLAGSGLTLVEGRDVPPFYLPEEDTVIQLLQQSWNALSGREDKPYAMGGVTHSKVLPGAITFGPGYALTAHNTPDFLPAGHGFPHGADEVTHLPSLLAALPHYVIALMRLDAWLARA